MRELLIIGVVGTIVLIIGQFLWLAIKWVLVAVGLMGAG